MSSPTSPTIETVIEMMPEDEISRLNALYETLLQTKIDSINEAVRTQVVKQNPNFPGIAGPIYDDTSSETTIDLQSGQAPSTSISRGSDVDYN
jgi:hypothetical protein